MLGKDNNTLEYFGAHKNEKYTLDEKDIKRVYRDLVGDNLDTGSRQRDSLSEHILQNWLLANESWSLLRKVRFSEQELPASKPVLNIKYHHPGS